MNFKPKTEKELSEARMLPSGTWPFEVIEASDTKSKRGHEMIKIKLNIFAGDRQGHVFDYLSAAFMEHRLRHYCYSVGLGAAYEAGTLTARQCLGRQGYAKIGFEDGKDGYSDKNVVEDYEVPASEEPPAPPTEPLVIESEGVPVDPVGKALAEPVTDDQMPPF
ncbi:MAG TPA: hypothetical protein VJ124_23580 [Pyrinomonadaceae bacterium]|nr:hypothetical protein [Pyrinomonadaceae bacterium]